MKSEFATPRRTVIAEAAGDIEDEDLIQREDMVVTVSHLGYIKRVPLSTYRAQQRGGKGRAGMQMREEDFVSRLFVAIDAYAGAVLLLAPARSTRKRSGGCRWRRRRRAARRSSTSCRSSRARPSPRIMPLPEDEKTLGQARRDVRHDQRQRSGATSCPTSSKVRPLRHHRDEARRRRRHRRRADLHREATTCC